MGERSYEEISSEHRKGGYPIVIPTLRCSSGVRFAYIGYVDYEDYIRYLKEKEEEERLSRKQRCEND